MAINLTEGAIAMLSSGEAQGAELKPVLQVADIRLVNTQNQNSNERYRILLSDGSFLQQGMLATQRNELVRSDKLQKGSVVQLTQFVCNLIQNRMIIIIIDLEIILQKCDPIGEPKQYPLKPEGEAPSAARSAGPTQPVSRPTTATPNVQPYGAGSTMSNSATRQNLACGTRVQPPEMDRHTGPHAQSASFGSNADSGRCDMTNAPPMNSMANAPPMYSKIEPGSGISRAPMNNYARPPQSLYQQQSPMFTNRGPIAKNEAPPRIIPIAALNPYQGRWTIKARVTAKAELRHYNNARGDGKVFSFDLLDSDGGEIRVTCFNAVADQFYHQIEPGRVYMISKGTLKPAQKAFNHLRNDHEIFLDSASTVQPCYEDDKSIPQQQFHFCSISDIEGMENNSIVDVIGVVSSISPSSSIMRKNGTETQKRSLQLKDMSGRSVELTLWGNFCNEEGQNLQNMCDSGVFPVLAVKSGRISDFNGKAVGTISTSQLFIEPDFPEARKLKMWFDKDGKNTPSVSISRETTGMGRTDVRKTVSQIKDERLGTSEKPDWITVSATVTFIKTENFCYTACPLMAGDRQCNKKVINNGDGKWRCERCDQSVDECDYRYILQFQIQDHTGLTWVTAFQESGEDIMGVSAKDLYFMKYEEQDDEKFSEVLRSVLFAKYVFKLKVKEETFSDEQRVKSTVVKAEKVNFQLETRYLLDQIAKLKGDDSGSLPLKSDNVTTSSGPNISGIAGGSREPAAPVSNYGPSSTMGRDMGVSTNQAGSLSNQYDGSQYGGSRLSSSSSGMHMNCNSCGGTGHTSVNCPSIINGQGQPYGGSFGGGAPSGGASSECFKCHQVGHWARDCPTYSNASSASIINGQGQPYEGGSFGGGAPSGGASSECFKCHQFGHWARDCPTYSNAPPAYGSGTVTPGRYGNVPKQRVGGF